MTEFIQKVDEMKVLLQESEYAFNIMMESGGGANFDYADYTSNNFIKSFRHVLQKPDLSRAQLASMLRNAERRKKRRDNDDAWAETVATLVTKGANQNLN